MQKTHKYFVYVLKSLVDKERYVGLSKNVPQRLREHNSRKVMSTKSRAPFENIHKEAYKTLAEARAREKYLKSAAGRRWLDKKGS